MPRSDNGRRGTGESSKAPLLEKQLGLWDVYALATGATLSSGFFLLPGLAAAGAGSALSLSYLLGAVILLPGLLAHVELATAMPRAGGIYYFLDRSLGPLVGTIGGFGTWIALTLKSAFALIGVGAYVQLFFPELQMGPLAAALAVFLGVVNYFGTKKTGTVQRVLLAGLAVSLSWFCARGLLSADVGNFAGFLDAGSAGIVSTAGLVIVSYMGLTKVVGVAEEVKNPGRNLPLGMFLAFGTVAAVFVLGTSVMVGVLGVEALARDGGDLTPVASTADVLAGRWGAILMTVAAVLAFVSAANAGVLSASRYPLAMARDRLLPSLFSRIGGPGTPTVGLAVTVGFIVLSVTLIDPTKIAKLASAFKLVIFALACLAVIVMRESRIDAYDPAYRSPLYPGAQIIGILAPLWLIVKMGLLPTLFTGGLILFGAMWYTYYARRRIDRVGAMYHVFARLGSQRADGVGAPSRPQALAEEETDPFTDLGGRTRVLDLNEPVDFTDLAERAAHLLATDLPVPANRLFEGFLERTRVGATPVSHGAAIPHLQIPGVARHSMILVRARLGVRFESTHDVPVQAVFFLVGPGGDPARHLHVLAQIAARVDQHDFMPEWLAASTEEELKQALLRNEGTLLGITLRSSGVGRDWIGQRLSEVPLPGGALIAAVRRGDELIVPTGDTALHEGDRLTVIGQQESLTQFREWIGLGKSAASGERDA